MAGTILYPDFNQYPGIFTELNPLDLPITSVLMGRGIDLLPQKAYTYTYHTNPDMVSPSLTLQTDFGTANLGSTGFTDGSNCMNVWYEGAGVSWARQNDQSLGRTLGFQGPQNLSFEADPSARAMADALLRVKTQFEYVTREGVLNMNTSGTVVWQQRGYRRAPGILNVGVGVAGGSAVGSLALLTKAMIDDALQTLWDRKVNGGDRLTLVCNSIAKRQIGSLYGDFYSSGKNGLSLTSVGRNVQHILTDFGEIDLLLTHTLPQTQMYILNLNQMRAVGHVAKGGQLFYETNQSPVGIAGDLSYIYTELGVDHGVGSCHARFYGIGSTAAHLTSGTVEAV